MRKPPHRERHLFIKTKKKTEDRREILQEGSDRDRDR